MVNGYKHLLAFGMESPDAYVDLPSMGNGFFKRYGVETLLSLWPLALLFLAYKCRQRARSARWPLFYYMPTVLFTAVGLLFLLNNFPYKFGKYDQYHGDQGLAPYQDFIDYVVEDHGGLVFWAHPEVSKIATKKIGPLSANLFTEPYYDDLLYTRNHGTRQKRKRPALSGEMS